MNPWIEFHPQLNFAGADEVGRGCLAGPVVGAAVVFSSTDHFEDYKDSKTLSEARRERLFESITQEHHWAVGMASIEEIAELNILWASQLAIERALESLYKKLGKIQHVYVDGHLPLKNWKLSLQTPIIQGDKKVKLIAAASIVAKVTRDRLMRELDLHFPQYGFAENKGYGVEGHRQALKVHGPTIHHRKSFRGVLEV